MNLEEHAVGLRQWLNVKGLLVDQNSWVVLKDPMVEENVKSNWPT